MKGWPSWGADQVHAEESLHQAEAMLVEYANRSPPALVSEHWPDDLVQHVYLCCSCLGRWEQIQATLPVNLLLLAPYFHRVTVVVATFGEDTKFQQWALENLGWAASQRFLALATGGSYSTQRGASVMQLLGAAEPLQHWHASKAKNAAHRVAAELVPPETPLSKVLFVNLDCDNVVGPNWLPQLAAAAATSRRRWSGGPSPAIRGSWGPLTGRIAVFAPQFLALGGYDQERGVLPSGLPAASHF